MSRLSTQDKKEEGKGECVKHMLLVEIKTLKTLILKRKLVLQL